MQAEERGLEIAKALTPHNQAECKRRLHFPLECFAALKWWKSRDLAPLRL
jgi:hypothetical protein